MKFIKKYSVIIAVVLPILILVILRVVGTNHFKSDAKSLAEPAFSGKNIISIENASALSGKKLIINLNYAEIKTEGIGYEFMNVAADSILNKTVFNTIHDYDGPVLLYSDKADLAARIWMILSQMGINDLFILSNNTDNEVLKYKFRSDTIVKPEL